MTPNPDWTYVADTVMGGVSQGQVTREVVQGRKADRLTGQVSLDNDGGFIQMATDLRPDGGVVDLSGSAGLELTVLGNGEVYEIRLRTDDLTRPWQSYRLAFTAPDVWTCVRIPFAELAPHRTQVPLNLSKARRVGILAIGRAFSADVALAGMRIYDAGTAGQDADADVACHPSVTR
ncbi:CIA30 family protein [Jannaschia sp. 2305UL9-9]|uniref:CIA30 family protein n=1 Tax=Jannaschia sp. 2305UL9-9 TaxID=3121638 RepID=UPI0035297B2F